MRRCALIGIALLLPTTLAGQSPAAREVPDGIMLQFERFADIFGSRLVTPQCSHTGREGRRQLGGLMTKRRRVIVHIATSADGFIAGPDGDLEWLTSLPAPKGFYGMNAFMRSVDTKMLGRKTYEASLALGATFDDKDRYVVFSRRPAPPDAPLGVDFVGGPIGPFIDQLRNQPGKDIWLMGGGELIASFLDENVIDAFVITVMPVFIGDGIPLIARRQRHVPLELQSTERFANGAVQLHYRVQHPLHHRPEV